MIIGENMNTSKHDFIVNGIKNLLIRNYGFDGDEVDIDSEVDDSLTFQENWNHIKRKYIHGELNITETYVKS